MKKTIVAKLGKGLMFSSLGILLITQSGCFGNFSLTRKVYTFNKSIENKVLRQIVFWAMCIVPVYGLAGTIDTVILNLIEFWTGTNPVSMTEGQREEQMVAAKDGIQYKMIATKNQFEIVALSGAQKGKSVFMRYNTNEQSWSYTAENKTTKLLQMTTDANGQIAVNYFDAKGNVAKIVSAAEVQNQYESMASAKLFSNNNTTVASK